VVRGNAVTIRDGVVLPRWEPALQDKGVLPHSNLYLIEYFGKYFTRTEYFGHLLEGIYVVVRVRAGKYEYITVLYINTVLYACTVIGNTVRPELLVCFSFALMRLSTSLCHHREP
jgi:hypothetical protein